MVRILFEIIKSKQDWLCLVFLVQDKIISQKPLAHNMAQESETMELPVELVKNCKGFTMDIGGSVVKLVYQDKDDYQELQNSGDKASRAKVCLASFSRSHVKEAIDLLQNRCHIKRDGGKDPIGVFTTGTGSGIYAAQFLKALNVKLNTVLEADCFVHAFKYLASRVPAQDFIHAHNQEAIDQARKKWELLASIGSQFSDQGASDATALDLTKLGRSGEAVYGEAPLAQDTNFYPCILGMLGSAFAYIKVLEDGSFQMFDVSSIGGRMFLGLGNLLTGAKSFEELIELASHGNMLNVDTTIADVMGGGTPVGEDVYSEAFGQIDFNETSFYFGKAADIDRDRFSREDLASALVNMMAAIVAEQGIANCAFIGAKHLFLCGSFTSTDLVRQQIDIAFTKRNVMRMAAGQGETAKLHIIKPGGHLGALGALINHTELFQK